MEKVLVACFSPGGTTAEKARALADAANAAYYEIRPAVPYTEKDLKYTNPLARCNREWIKREVPALGGAMPDVSACDRIFLCFPIWYYTAPLILCGFLRRLDLRGKTIVLFATSGGSDMKRAEKFLAPSAPGARFVTGEMLNGASPEILHAIAREYGG